MTSIRFVAVIFIAFVVAGCDKGPTDAAISPRPSTEVVAPSADADVPAASAERFLAALDLSFPYEVTNQRRVRSKAGASRAEVLAIDFKGGSVQSVDRELSKALATAGFERVARTRVTGGIRVAYVSQDGRRVSTMIRNKKYFGERIAESAAGQISLSYVVD